MVLLRRLRVISILRSDRGMEKWNEVDQYFATKFSLHDEILDKVQQNSHDADLPAISISACQGMFLQILAATRPDGRILEIGTLGGYSAICMARGLGERGRLVTVEFEPEHAKVAQNNFKLAGLEEKISLINDDAIDAMQKLIEHKVEPFDLIFLDADKQSYKKYLELALQLSRAGTLIVADNVVRRGEVANPATEDEKVLGIRSFCDSLEKKPNHRTTVLQTVGSKGYDGFSVTMVGKA